MSDKLTKLDWLQAGFRALTKAGPQALKAEPLAKTLKVSKGSFYWHFKDIAAFKAEMIAHWQQAATADIIALVETGAAHPVEKLLSLARHSTSSPSTKYGGPASESAIRDWSKYEPSIARIISSIDAQRIAFTTSLFQEAGHSKKQARQSARLVYSALIGLEVLAPAKHTTPEADLSSLVRLLLTQPAAR